MRGMLIQLLVTAFALWVADELLDRVIIDDLPTLLISAAVLGLVNAFIRPILTFLTFPFTIITLGLFLFVLNAAMLLLASSLVPGFEIQGLATAFFAWVIVSLASAMASMLVGEQSARD
ncbi:MAG: phage holin family protein [Pseudomonadota bacterium]